MRIIKLDAGDEQTFKEINRPVAGLRLRWKTMEKLEDRRLTAENVKEIICCPGGLEVEGQKFKGEIGRTATWREEMLELGMRGFISYWDGLARGFIEYMPAETAPFHIEAPGAAVLMCYHWIPAVESDEEKHLVQEKRLINLVIEEAKGKFSGLATLGWDHPTHFPISFLKEIGFQEVQRTEYIALMWLPLQPAAPRPQMAPASFNPQDLSSEGLLAIESAWSSRCPYSIHNAARLERVIAKIPGKERIRHFPHRIDTHEQAIRWPVSPWNWEWAFSNGEEIPIFELKSAELESFIADKLAQLR